VTKKILIFLFCENIAGDPLGREQHHQRNVTNSTNKAIKKKKARRQI